MTEQQKYDPEIEYDKIISWLRQEIWGDDLYKEICSKISEYGLAMYEKGCGEATEVITNRIKQYTDDSSRNSNQTQDAT